MKEHDEAYFDHASNVLFGKIKLKFIHVKKVKMREKYKRNIWKFAENSLKKSLLQTIYPYTITIPDKIKQEIIKEIMDFPLPDEESLGPRDRLGSKLQSEGKAISGSIIDKIFLKTIPYIKIDIMSKKVNLAQKRLFFDQSKDRIIMLKNKIEYGFIGKSRYWRGADVIVTTKLIEEEYLPWTHTSDIQIVTENENLAHSISWLFCQIRDIMSPFIDYRNKYEFYGSLAKAANKIIKSDEEYSEEDVFFSILSECEILRSQWFPVLYNQLESEKILLDEFDNWLSKKLQDICNSCGTINPV